MPINSNFAAGAPTPGNERYVANPYLVDEKRRLVPKIKIVNIDHNTL
jgi:hypothetical protein